MKLSNGLGLVVVLAVTLLTTSCGLSKPSIVRTGPTSDPLYCPKLATDARPPLRRPPSTKEDAEFRKWAGELYGEYVRLHFIDAVLLDCWHNEQEKRARK